MRVLVEGVFLTIDFTAEQRYHSRWAAPLRRIYLPLGMRGGGRIAAGRRTDVAICTAEERPGLPLF